MATSDGFPTRKDIKIVPCEFEDMNLQLGERLELELLSSSGHPRYVTTLIGCIPRESLLVRTPVVNAVAVPIREDERILVRLFSGTKVFSFETPVMRVCVSPSHYLHLAFPRQIQCADIRSAIRMTTGLPGIVRKATDVTGEHPVRVTITNISIGGAHVAVRENLGNVGAELQLRFGFRLHPNDYEVHVETTATIQSVTPAGKGYEYGLHFENLGSAQTILLQNFVYQLLVEEHKHIA
jgi:c-di-GMP-binding flagellar brake protein YcgR